MRRVPGWVWITGAVCVLAGALLFFLEPWGSDFLEAPAPELVDEEDDPPAPEASTLAVPLVIPLSTLVELLEESLPREYGSLEERHELPDRDRTTLAFALERQPVRATMDGDVARVETVVEYALRAYYDPPVFPEVSGSCGTDEGEKRSLRVVIEAPLRLTEEWRLATRAEVVSVEPPTEDEDDRCRVTFLELDVTDRVVEAARSFLVEQEETIDSIAGSLDLRPSFEAWWETLRAPVELDDSVWLVSKPESVRQGAIRGSADSLRVDLALEARPSIVVGAEPEVEIRGLPALGGGQVEPGLDILVEGRADYANISRVLMDELVGAEVEHEGRTVTLDSIRVFGIGGGRISLDVRVSGDLAARLFFTGTPGLDSEEQVISVPDLDFDVQTEDVVVAAASWLRQVGLRRFLREQARWPAAPATEWLAEWLDRGLNRDISDDLRVAGRVESVTPREVYALRDYVLVRIAAQAEAEVYVVDP